MPTQERPDRGPGPPEGPARPGQPVGGAGRRHPPASGTVYGAGRVPVGGRRDWLLTAAAVTGGLGLVLGLLFATGLTPFAPESANPPPPAAAPVRSAVPTGAGETTASGPPESTPPATTAAPRTRALKAVVSGLCLEPASPDGVDGVPVHQVPCGDAPTQRWRLDVDGDVVTVVNAATGGCLDVAGASQDNGAAVQQWTCFPVPQQRWRAVPTGSGVALVSLISGRCLDVPGASRDAGARMQQFDCNGTPAQQWLFG